MIRMKAIITFCRQTTNYRVFFTIEKTEIFDFVINADLRFPFLVDFIPRHSDNTRGIAFVELHVLAVGLVGGLFEVLQPIGRTIVVFVVNLVREIPVHEAPDEPMANIVAVIDGHLKIAVGVHGAGRFPRIASVPYPLTAQRNEVFARTLPPPQLASIWVVIEKLAETFLGNGFTAHLQGLHPTALNRQVTRPAHDTFDRRLSIAR